ncbi:MAG TPA: FmdB family zinc ribbon protein [Fimbriimonadaceae bacterium]|nr:FmdB family zinc ribbon protein [Fimbriimonadaceae bacterium]
MPTYVYECSSCNSTFEVEQRISEDPLDSCACGSAGTVKRLIQPIAVMFKGSGFHINDYSSSPGEAAKAEAASEAKAGPAPACTGEPAACPACQPSEA